MLGMKQPGLWKVVALARGPARKSLGPHCGLSATGARSLSPQPACLPHALPHAQPGLLSRGCVLWQSLPGPRHMPGWPSGGTLAGEGRARPPHASSPLTPASESWQPTPWPGGLQPGLPSSAVQIHPPGLVCRVNSPGGLKISLTWWLPGVGGMNRGEPREFLGQ